MTELQDGTRLSREQTELLIRLTDAYNQRDDNGQREQFVFVTTGGGAGTSMMHRGIPEDDDGLDLGDLKDLEELGLVEAEYKNAMQGNFRVTARGVGAVEYIRERERALSEPAVVPSDATALGVDWATEVQPVLQAVIDLFPTAPAHRGVSQDAINDRLGREQGDPRTSRVLRKLEEADYIVGKISADQVEGPLFCEPAPKALELLAGWPTDRGDALLARLIEGLEARIEATPDEEEKSKLRKVLASVREVSQGVMVAVLSDAITGG